MASGAEGSSSGGGQQIILPHALTVINAFCDMDEEFIKNERYLDDLIFGETAVPWSIHWGHMDEFKEATTGTVSTEDASTTSLGQKSETEAYRPEWLNCDDFRIKLRRFLSRGRVLARRQSFCAYWVLDEQHMADWLYMYARSNAADREAMPAPFGIIESSEALFARSITPRRDKVVSAPVLTVLGTISPVWYYPSIGGSAPNTSTGVPEGGPRGVRMAVFGDYMERLVSPTPAQYYELVQSASSSYPTVPAVKYSRFGGSADGSGTVPGSTILALTAQNALIPGTPIFELMRHKNRILEAQNNLAQAEGVAIQSAVILGQTRPRLDRARGTNPAPDPNFDYETTQDNLLQDVYREQAYTWDQWLARYNDIQRMQNPDFDRLPSGQKTSSDRHRLAYGRPARFENMVTLVEGVDPRHVTEPKVLTDLVALETKYREDVAELIGLVPPGRGLMQSNSTGFNRRNQTQTVGAASVYGDTREAPIENHLQHVVQNERNWITQLFASMYKHGFHNLDMEAIDDMVAISQLERVRMREARLAIKALESGMRRDTAVLEGRKSSAAAVAEAINDDWDKYADKLEELKEAQRTAGTKAERKRVRVRARQVRDWFEFLRSRPDAVARLKFEPVMTQRAAKQLDVLLSYVTQGLVSAAEVQPYFERQFPGVHVKDPPKPEAPAGGGGPKKK